MVCAGCAPISNTLLCSTAAGPASACSNGAPQLGQAQHAAVGQLQLAGSQLVLSHQPRQLLLPSLQGSGGQ